MKIRNKWATTRLIAATGDRVKPGKTVNVEDKELADRLLDQPDVWGKSASTKKTNDSEDS